MSDRSQRSVPGYLDFDLEIGPGSGREYPTNAEKAGYGWVWNGSKREQVQVVRGGSWSNFQARWWV